MGKPEYFTIDDRVRHATNEFETTIIAGPFFMVGSVFAFYATRYDQLTEPFMIQVAHGFPSLADWQKIS